MKIKVINLSSRKDRLAFMTEQLKDYSWERVDALNGHNLTLQDINQLGFHSDLEWRDPLLGRRHTNTDLAAMISHFRVWEMCANDTENYLILEDDAELLRPIDFTEINTLLNLYDVAYLDHREMVEKRILHVNDQYFIPYYPYWNSAYVITPKAAKLLINSGYKDNLIPVDEYFPLMFGVDYNQHCLSKDTKIKNNFIHLQNVLTAKGMLQPIAFKNKIFKQKPRSELGSDIEGGKIMKPTKTVHLLTVATDESKLKYLRLSKNNIASRFVNLGKGKEWTGGDMSRPGGGMKIRLVKEFIEDKDNNDYVLFVDGHDVFINDDLDTITERFEGFGVDALFAAEKVCWPDKSMETWFPKSGTGYDYLNSGVYMSTVKALKKLLNTPFVDFEDDQLYLQKQFVRAKVEGIIKVGLDHENYIFQCLANAYEDITINKHRQFLNTKTRCCTCILHGNGGDSTKKQFDELVDKVTSKPAAPAINYTSPVKFEPATKFDIAGPDVLEMDFLSPENCQKMIDMAEAHGNWQSMYGDKFPGQEIRIREFSMDLWNDLENHFKKVVNPLIEKHWWPLLMYGLRDAFIIKYNQESQSNLKCHHDASLVSGLVKLNDGYTGGDTYFYRQDYSNINTPVGKMILWPGQVTHGHEGRTVNTGTKYNLVIWTSRHRNDINY